jgi:CRISPR-associated exonuclease Cas4
MKSFSIPISIIRQHIFCPRIPFFQFLLGINPTKPIWTRQGNEFQKVQIFHQRRRKLSRFKIENAKIISNYHVHSESLGLHGFVDLFLETDDEVIPVEIKLESSKFQKSHILQLYSYGLCLEEKFQKPFDRGFLLFGKKGKVIEIQKNQDIQNSILNYIIEIRKNISDMFMPDSPAKVEQCIQCEYRNQCNDRDI